MRFLIVSFICTVIFFANAIPTLAAKSPVDKGAEQLDKIQEKTENVMRSAPRSLEEMQRETREGINAVQGSADRAKMKGANAQTQTETMAEKFKEGVRNTLGDN
jgi:t-SNARE complex subunit (syntaxin)